jgi:hypothetical protein
MERAPASVLLMAGAWFACEKGPGSTVIRADGRAESRGDRCEMGKQRGGGIITCPSFHGDKLGARGQWPTHQTVVAQRVEGPAGTVVAANVIGMSRLGAGARTRGWSIWPMVRARLGAMWNCASGLGHTVSLGCALLACFLIPKRFSKFTQSSEFKNAKHDISSS